MDSQEPYQRRLIGMLLLTVAFGGVGMAILGVWPGIVCAVLIFSALLVSENL